MNNFAQIKHASFMKKFMISFLCVLMLFCCVGCGDKEFPSAKITRDDLRVGGSLSFVYDQNARTVYVGGKDEVIQFSAQNDELGFGEGTRIGLKISAPDEEFDVNNATFEMHGTNYSSGDFLEEINGQKQRFFNIYPLLSKEDKEVCFTLKWQDNMKEQKYKIVVLEGTRFMDKNGNVSD